MLIKRGVNFYGKTLVLIKTDAVDRKLMGEIITIYENHFHITAIKIIKPSLEIAKEHYFERKDKPFFKDLINFITRSEVCALIIKGENVIDEVRKIMKRSVAS